MIGDRYHGRAKKTLYYKCTKFNKGKLSANNYATSYWVVVMKNLFFAVLFTTTSTVTVTTSKGISSTTTAQEFPENVTTEEVQNIESQSGKHSLDEIDLFSPTAAPEK